MSVAMRKNISLGLVLAFVFSLFMMLTAPIQAHAESKGDDIGGVEVKVGEDGKLSITGNENFSNGGTKSAWNTLFTKYRTFIVGISGIGAISMIVFFVIQFMRLGASAGNPSARSQALVGVLWTGLAAAGLGAVTIVVGFFYNSIK